MPCLREHINRLYCMNFKGAGQKPTYIFRQRRRITRNVYYSFRLEIYQSFKGFFMALLRARHEDKKDLLDPAVMEEAAVAAGLDMARFREDQADPELLKDIGESHTLAVEEYGAFGVPTFVFDEGKTAFLKMFIPPDEQAADIYETMTKAMSQFDHVGEFKRPQPPWPHGVI